VADAAAEGAARRVPLLTLDTVPDPDGGSFAPGREAWLARLGNLRNVLRQELVTRQLAPHLPSTPATCLDVGAGQGTQAIRLAARGFAVVAVEPDRRMREQLVAAAGELPAPDRDRVQVLDGGLGRLAEALGGTSGFDVVLCQGVLMYVADPAPALRELAGLTAPGGVLSLVFRNADGIAMRPALRRDWAEMHALLDAAGTTATYTNEIGAHARADRVPDVEAVLGSAGLRTEAWYGVRVATDGVALDEPVPADPADLEAMLDAEERLGRTDPYRQVATLAHLVSIRPGARRPDPAA
jgi:S-adenosylmethionine-dependent methyltransferase